MHQPVGPTSSVPTLPTTVVFSDEFLKVIGVLLSEDEVEHVCRNAVNNAVAGNVSPENPDLYEFIIPAKNVRVLYQFRHDFSRLYVIAAFPIAWKKPTVAFKKSADSAAIDAEVRGLRKLKVGVRPREFLQWLVKRFFRRHDD